MGNAVLKIYNSINWVARKLNNKLLVPQISKNLISISQLPKDNVVMIEFFDKFF